MAGFRLNSVLQMWLVVWGFGGFVMLGRDCTGWAGQEEVACELECVAAYMTERRERRATMNAA